MTRSLSIFLLVTALFSAVFLSPLGCGSSETSVFDDDDGGVARDGGELEGLVSIAVDPPESTIALVRGEGGRYTATTKLTAVGTFEDGSTRDITALSNWTPSVLSASAVHGDVRVSAPGVVTIRVDAADRNASATLTVTLSGAERAEGIDDATAAKLDAPVGAGAKTTIAYPTEGALFPANLNPLTVHVRKTVDAQSVVRLSLKAGDLVDFQYYAPCEDGPNATLGCYVSLPKALVPILSGPSESGDVAFTARIAGADGASLVESDAVNTAFSEAPLTGGLYYWTTIDASQDAGSTAIFRYDLQGDTAQPELVYSNKGSPASHRDSNDCVGCHTISPDGSKLSLTIGGSFPGDFMLIDIATRTRTVVKNEEFATLSAFDPTGQRIVTAYRGDLTLRGADMTLADQGPVLASVAEKKTDIFWSPDGKLFTFTGWIPGENEAPLPTDDGDLGKHALNGDLKWGAQIFIADSNGRTVTNEARVLVAREPGVAANYYPAVSDDGALVVYNRSDCGGVATTKYNGKTSACAGYDDFSAKIRLISPRGGTAVEPARANGVGDFGNSWPRWSPDHATFRGKRLYWVAFSSRRPYGLQVNHSGATKPQLWFAAIAVEPGKELAGDPSYSAIWLPAQNPNQAVPNGNHVPQWVKQAVQILK